MNIFEDLIEELKDENLLETTVVENRQTKSAGAVVEKENAAPSGVPLEITEAAIVAGDEDDPVAAANREAARKTAEIEFFRKRAKDEVAFLQMVEYVFAGVEREQLKIAPQPYNDLKVRKDLHTFLQASGEPQSAAHGDAQFELLQETESWHSSLALRDANFLTANLRRFCEQSRPPLGAPALVALARFYRNSTFSEPVRSKFDLIVTRLFSKETDNFRRETLHDAEELSRRAAKFYADWSSVPLYPTAADDPKILEIVNEFADFTREADRAVFFDDLINGDFFKRLYQFKASLNVNFFAPAVVAAAVESNVCIGNRYVELLEKEQETGNAQNLRNKFEPSHDQTVSEATGKSLVLNELLHPKPATSAAPVEEEKETAHTILVKDEPPPARRQKPESPAAAPTETAVAAATADKTRLIVLGAAGAVLLLLIVYLLIG